jgi:hypothetical protein
MPIILATQEAEIRRTMVQIQIQASNSEDPISQKTHYKKKAGTKAQEVRVPA